MLLKDFESYVIMLECVFATSDSPVIFDGQFTSIMSAPLEVARRGWAWRKSDDAHAHEHACFTYTDPLQVTNVLCVHACDTGTETDRGTDTEDVESCVPNFVSLLCR
jgi:hypothetical protein